MSGIKKLRLITEKVADFQFGDFKFIIDFKYSIEIDTISLFDEHNYSILDISFILIPKDKLKKFKVTIRFKKLGSLQLSAGGTAIQLSGFEILDISDRGWDSVKYLVRDYEYEEGLKFYCNDIEIIAIEEIEDIDLIVD
ncbi:hypothetical protein [Paenibacillus eucommiae]|uniref:Immunity protein 50 n=1 Tax=Paenibacillus eucommiae TaxID=1355755 RepID=A0ABS4JAT5_9BACL|nr:hypothetical protein [Paenibacillus eucommiae]MBP1996958.1 hypothetical protein [Paenibacillus eucommiae]